MIIWSSSKVLWEKKSDWVALCIVSLRRSSSQALGEELKSLELCKIQILLPKSSQQIVLWSTLVHTTQLWSFSTTVHSNPKSLYKVPAKKFYLVWCQSKFRILFCHTFSRENLNAFFPPLTKNLLFSEQSFLSKASWVVRTCGIFRRADEKPRG